MNKQEQLDLLNEKVKICTKCPLLVENRTQTVFGVGDPNSSIVFCGEAPGKDEDDQGEPFVGRAGQLLNTFFTDCKFRREDIYILNICKCRPPSNRQPLPEEANNCRPFLELQLQVINPKFIVCMGATAAQNLLKTTERITNLRGMWHEFNCGHVAAKVLCTYHPAYVLRNPAAKGLVWEDLQLLLEDLRKFGSQSTETNV